MGVVNLRDAVVLAMLKDKIHSKKEIEGSLDMTKMNTRKALSFLKSLGLVEGKNIRGEMCYSITREGTFELETICNNVRS